MGKDIRGAYHTGMLILIAGDGQPHYFKLQPEDSNEDDVITNIRGPKITITDASIGSDYFCIAAFPSIWVYRRNRTDWHKRLDVEYAENDKNPKIKNVIIRGNCVAAYYQGEYLRGKQKIFYWNLNDHRKILSPFRSSRVSIIPKEIVLSQDNMNVALCATRCADLFSRRQDDQFSLLAKIPCTRQFPCGYSPNDQDFHLHIDSNCCYIVTGIYKDIKKVQEEDLRTPIIELRDVFSSQVRLRIELTNVDNQLGQFRDFSADGAVIICIFEFGIYRILFSDVSDVSDVSSSRTIFIDHWINSYVLAQYKCFQYPSSSPSPSSSSSSSIDSGSGTAQARAGTELPSAGRGRQLETRRAS